MRARRKRFTAPRARVARELSTRTLEGVTWYRNSPAGRHAKFQALGEQCERQNSTCHLCGQRLSLPEAKFEFTEFKAGAENRAIHKTNCI